MRLQFPHIVRHLIHSPFYAAHMPRRLIDFQLDTSVCSVVAWTDASVVTVSSVEIPPKRFPMPSSNGLERSTTPPEWCLAKLPVRPSEVCPGTAGRQSPIRMTIPLETSTKQVHRHILQGQVLCFKNRNKSSRKSTRILATSCYHASNDLVSCRNQSVACATGCVSWPHLQSIHVKSKMTWQIKGFWPVSSFLFNPKSPCPSESHVFQAENTPARICPASREPRY